MLDLITPLPVTLTAANEKQLFSDSRKGRADAFPLRALC
jgi:hypothetical protein